MKDHEDIAVILVDQYKLKGSDTSFLKKKMEYAPDAIGILVTGFAAMEAVADTLSKGQIFYFINKSWSFIEMNLTLKRALYTYQLSTSNKKLKALTEQQEGENLEVQLNLLQCQVNPHFLFNCFNNISAMVGDNIPALNFVKNLAEMYRFTFKENNNYLSTLLEEKQFIDRYIYIQQERFGDSLIIDNLMAVDLESYKIPKSSLLLLVENAIKHNVSTKERPLRISIQVIEDYLVVLNNYQPKKFVNSTRFGQKNLIKRY